MIKFVLFAFLEEMSGHLSMARYEEGFEVITF
jgi:hypothetical protein